MFELVNNPAQVLKVYTEPLTPLKVSKLRLMASLAGDAMRQYAAWPDDVVTAANGQVVGFAMQKLVNYYPLHMLFSPMDRKRLFPDKGYNFLVHVARNLASAFYALHNAGLVVGDVNEGNILVNARGMVAFIDCDSFQIKYGNSYHFCEVGVPRYTPPELLEKTSFSNIVRTVNTDVFSMAVLIFQLLFLGRHPFAGKNLSVEDIEEETAIKQHLFAYSTRNKHNKLSPPNDSFSISWLTPELSGLFHTAFERRDNRPAPAAWVTALGNFLQTLVACNNAKIHLYPAAAGTCVWCMFKQKRNILYFFDDSMLNGWQQVSDIENFINGFKVEKLHLPPFERANLPEPQVQPTPIDKKYTTLKTRQMWATGAIIILAVLLTPWLMFWSILLVVLSRFIVMMLPWRMGYREELKRREVEHSTLAARFETTIRDYNKPVELTNYNTTAEKLVGLMSEFKNLPQELKDKRQQVEERHYNEQLQSFLAGFVIKDHTISSIGEARKQSLSDSGIVTAQDVSKLYFTKVQGIGPVYIQILVSWQRQVMSNFVYMPDSMWMTKAYESVILEHESRKKHLEREIKAQYHALQSIKSSIAVKRSMLQKQAERLNVEIAQAYVNLASFKNIA